MPRRQKNSGRKRTNNGSSSSSSLQSQTLTFRSREVPLRITQASSGTGGLTTSTSGGSYTAANSVNIDPFNIGGRVSVAAQLFAKYKIKYLRIRYIPDDTSSGVADQVAGNSTTPSYGSRTFAWGINRDPALSTLTFNQLVQLGGSVGNTTRPQNLIFKNRDPQWYFTSTTAASPTTIDLRMAAPLQLRFAYFNASTTAVASYGQLLFDIMIQFNGILPSSTPLGFSLTLSSPFESDSKSQESDGSLVDRLVTGIKTKTQDDLPHGDKWSLDLV